MLRRTLTRRLDLLMRQMELRVPLTKNDKPVTSYSEEFFRPPVNEPMKAKYGVYAKYSTPENAQISDLAAREEVVLNTYPEGDSKGLIYNQHSKDTITTNYTASYDENFFRKHLLKGKAADEDKDRVIDLALNATITGLSFLTIRYAIAPLWWMGQPKMTLVSLSNVEVELGPMEEKECKTVVWRGKPVYIYHRSQTQIEQSDAVPMSALKHPEKDSDRFKHRRDYTVVIAICTHLGCVPAPNEGMFGGYFCPCHGSHYDISGRIRQGPAPLNLEVPPHRWIDDNTVYLGT